MYAAIGTWPDITYAVQHLSQFTSNPSPAHWSAIKRVFWYLNGTHEYGITYGGGNTVPILEGFSDADWGNSDLNHKSSTLPCLGYSMEWGMDSILLVDGFHGMGDGFHTFSRWIPYFFHGMGDGLHTFLRWIP